MDARPAPSRYEIAAWLFAAAALFGVLQWHLLPALLAGLLVYELTHVLAARLPVGVQLTSRRKAIAVALLAAVVVLLVTLALFGLAAFLRSESGSLTVLLGKMAETIEGFRSKMPEWLADKLPGNVDAIKDAIGHWLREHAVELQTAGREAGRAVAHLLLGMIIGALVALRQATDPNTDAPLAAALKEKLEHLGDAFRRVVFAQVKISAVNAFLTALYLALALPIFGIKLPLTKSLIAATFIFGLIPVLGNLLSNTAIVIVSFSYSVEVAAASLVFLVAIHKLEYFLNARIVGVGIGARAWELLVAMVVMEAIFGLPGVVAAPIYYAYLKGELAERGLI